MGRRVAGTAALCGILVFLASCSPKAVETHSEVGRTPNMNPDYVGTTVPPNIAPLNFQVLEEGRDYFLKVHSESGPPIAVFSKSGQMRIPLRPWRGLLDANRGKNLLFDIKNNIGGKKR